MKEPRNLWPFGIIGAFALFVAGAASLIAMACAQKSELVSPNYYEEELRFQGQMERLERARRLDVPACVTYDSAQKRLAISLPLEAAKRPRQIHVHLYRPSEAGLDQQRDLHLDPSGGQFLDASELRPGLWQVKISWTVDGLDYLVDQRVIVGLNKRQ